MKKFVAIVSFIIMLSPFLLTACWDNRDIENMHIVTGVSLDLNEEDENLIDITMQVTNIHSGGSSGSNQPGGGDQKPIILKKTAKTVSMALKKLHDESNRLIFLHHIEVLLIGMDLAKKGIDKYIDFFLRDTQARLEIPLLIVEGRGEDVITAEIQEDNQSTLFLADSFEDAKKITKEIHVRLIDIAFKLVCRHNCPIIPVVKVMPAEEKKKIADVGFVLIKDSKATDTIISVDDIFGYLFVKDTVHFVDAQIEVSENDIVDLRIIQLEPSPSVKVEGDKVTFEIGINVEASISEQKGFADLSTIEQVELFKTLLQQDIEKKILTTFQIAKDNKCDFYGVSEILHKHQPRVWARLKDRWEDLIPTIEVKLDVKPKIISAGQTVESLEMEKVKNDTR